MRKPEVPQLEKDADPIKVLNLLIEFLCERGLSGCEVTEDRNGLNAIIKANPDQLRDFLIGHWVPLVIPSKED